MGWAPPTQTNAQAQGSGGKISKPESACSFDSMSIDRSDLEVKILLRALNIVACAFRPLDAEELIEALKTQTPPLSDPQDRGGDASWLRTSEDLRTLCVGFLEIQDSGVVQFSNDNLKKSVLSHDFATQNLPCGSDGHELLAMVCIQHLQCLPSRTMLRPLIPATHWQTEAKHECAMRTYTATFWHDHSRIALVYSREIPAMLHRAFLSALSGRGRPELTSKEKTNMALWLSTVNNFKLLCRTYLEMGADPNSCTDWHEAPIHTAARSSTGQIVRLLIERGANLDLRNGEGLTPLHVACRSGNLEAAQVFIEAGVDVNAQTSAKTNSYHGACTPLHHALLCGQLEVVQMLLSQPQLGTRGLQEALVKMENLGSDIRAWIISGEGVEDHESLMNLLTFENSLRATWQVAYQDQDRPFGLQQYLVASGQPSDVWSLGSVITELIFSPEGEGFGWDLQTPMPIKYGKTREQKYRHIPQNDNGCLCQTLDTAGRRASTSQRLAGVGTKFHPHLCQGIDELKRRSLLTAPNVNDIFKEEVAGESIDKNYLEESGALRWRPSHSPEPFPTKTDLVAGSPGQHFLGKVVCEEVHGQTPSVAYILILCEGLPLQNPNAAFVLCPPVGKTSKHDIIIFSGSQIYVSPDIRERFVSITNRIADGEDWLMIDKDDVDKDIWQL